MNENVKFIMIKRRSWANLVKKCYKKIGLIKRLYKIIDKIFTIPIALRIFVSLVMCNIRKLR